LPGYRLEPRSTQRNVGQRASIDEALASRMSELSRENPCYGYRRVWALLRREGWDVNKKRVLRLWREQGLKVPHKQHNSQRLGIGSGENGVSKRRALSTRAISLLL
jgi:putative transposase